MIGANSLPVQIQQILPGRKYVGAGAAVVVAMAVAVAGAVAATPNHFSSCSSEMRMEVMITCAEKISLFIQPAGRACREILGPSEQRVSAR